MRDAILAAIQAADAQPSGNDAYGARFVVEFNATFNAAEGAIRTLWIVRVGENFPRLTSCFVV